MMLFGGPGGCLVFMLIGNSLVADSARFRELPDGLRVLDYLDERLRALGATHVLVTGVPLPGRPIDPLLLRLRWGELRAGRGDAVGLDREDPLLRWALSVHQSMLSPAGSPEAPIAGSNLYRLAGKGDVLVIPVHAFLPYQAVVVAVGPLPAFEPWTIRTLEDFCVEAFRRPFDLGFVGPARPGDLSARERKVVELSALGQTAGDIAAALHISQRTVHAHLQNASEKLHASNKTQTVVEALRYGQISV